MSLRAANVRNAKHRGEALVDQAAQTADELFRAACDLGAFHGKLLVDHAAHLHDGRKRIALRGTEIEPGRAR